VGGQEQQRATAAKLSQPSGVVVDSAGNLFVADLGNHCIWKIAAGTGIINIIAGTGESGFSGDGGPASTARLYWPHGVAVDSDGNVFIADSLNSRVRVVRGPIP